MTDGAGLNIWLAGAPEVRGDGDLLARLVSELGALLRPYGVDSAVSSEPRVYRLTPRGRALLAQALRNQQVGMLVFSSSAARGPVKGGADLVVDLESSGGQGGVSIDASISPTTGTSLLELAADFSEFVLRWFLPLRASAAFITDHLSGGWPYTDHELRLGLPILSTWSAARHYLRGAFWGTALGPELCNRLGGQERVLRDAPVALARPLGGGAWLQLSPLLPASTEQIARLEGFLAPILHWTGEDLAALRPPVATAASQSITTPMPVSAPTPQRAIPVHVLEYDITLDMTHPGPPSLAERAILDSETALTIYVTAPLTGPRQSVLRATVRAWSDKWLDPGHAHGDPSFDVGQAAMRLQVEFTHADAFEALRDLVWRLVALSDVTTIKIVVGWEEVG